WDALQRIRVTAPGWNLVTLDGQARLREGTIRAGRGKGSGNNLLAQSREWAALPAMLAHAESEQSSTQAALTESRHRLQENQTFLQKVEREIAELARQIEK